MYTLRGNKSVLTLTRCIITISAVGLTAAVTTPGSNLSVQFSRGVGEYRPLRTYVDVSLARCRRECGRRGACRGVIYNRRAKQCTLVAGFESDVTPGDGRGKVIVTGMNPDAYVMCDGKKCTGQCIQEGDTDVCKITECGPPPQLFTQLRGNMYSLGNNLVLAAGESETRIKCTADGTWQPENTDVFRDCTDLTGVSGQYILQPSLQGVYCDMDTDGGQWLVFQRRQDGSENFLRGWHDYVAGFGSLDGEFWLGLDTIYKILSTGEFEFELRVDLESFSGERRYAQYSSFSLSGPSDNFRLAISGYSGNANDSLLNHNGMMFSTFDNDNDDNDADNCADIYTGAWWYKACHWSNLNGLYFGGGQNTTVYATHIHWRAWLGYYHSLKWTEMKLRRK